ncbi:response regulator transcription factor [Capnocytophaga cynodegmi]|uniref:DNA-binding response regulator n=1 Tax=Capnocytophaga cynodegmi TaxID=28189 RepID=A0A0B7HEA4_9FLAO|nr:response regulator transcription factor [Capnocytophaga cynodegmi]ATA68776.1 DNA-binding response regulator [Capnocytophaga cynodegmi]CEN36197.1 Two component transcriptional regulator, LuxR family [Capnocytophaga cynodegmi]GIM52967.1 DNA-binding response regulator [Capnocytophaga cynodegmi]GIM55310.1 DNA-binding response regulator [Capnocytophaga cynodegmi]GJQ07751.1 DNA-binding response regulator [Capnocytophaga cynodegmi]
MIRIIICDDHPIINEGLQSFITTHPLMEVVATASNIKQLDEVLKNVITDVLLLDINLPDGKASEICFNIKQNYPNIKILGLSNIDDPFVIQQMINDGASGYLLKSSPMAEIEEAILQIYDGNSYLSKQIINLLMPSESNSEEIPIITRREREVLKYLSEGLSSAQIADKMNISPLTVDSHRKNLMQKFNVNKTVNLLQKAKGLV